jgi:anti-sigma B factor antagonist
MIGTRTADTATILDLHGPLTSGQDDAGLRQAVRLAFDNGARIVILNMAAVPAVDSSGVAALASGHMTAVNRGGQLRLCNLTPKLKDIFAVMRLDTVFDSYATEADAMAAARAQRV